ncbi:hypothetical protein F8388_018037 [Cannabis sativa]|uniref:WRKY domain-containing protein n=1 Tax=Cannabis sativa TaxID=3483 RepID=A0A7J6E8Q3_CANSA|nr:hypothetical protein F8388_018037 [Cannabis sativa]
MLSGFPNTTNPNPNPLIFSSSSLGQDQDWLCGSNNYNHDHQKPLISSSSPNYDEQCLMINKGNDDDDDKNKGKTMNNDIGRKKKDSSPHHQRVAFHTRSDDDVLDDGYRWRKYGQKTVKNNSHPSWRRSKIQRLSKDKDVVVTTYEGIHNHPSHNLMQALAPILNQLQFLSTTI